MRILHILSTVLLLLAAALPASAEQAPRTTAQLKVLVVSPVEQRGKAYQELFTKHGLGCSVVAYDKLTADDMQSHDVILFDSAEPTSQQYKQRMTVNFKALPKTDKPVIAMGYYGYFYLREFQLALGTVKT